MKEGAIDEINPINKRHQQHEPPQQPLRTATPTRDTAHMKLMAAKSMLYGFDDDHSDGDGTSLTQSITTDGDRWVDHMDTPLGIDIGRRTEVLARLPPGSL